MMTERMSCGLTRTVRILQCKTLENKKRQRKTAGALRAIQEPNH